MSYLRHGAQAEITYAYFPKSECEVGVDKVCQIAWQTNKCTSNDLYTFALEFLGWEPDGTGVDRGNPKNFRFEVGKFRERQSYHEWRDTTDLEPNAHYKLLTQEAAYVYPNTEVNSTDYVTVLGVLAFTSYLDETSGSTCPAAEALSPAVSAGIGAGAGLAVSLVAILLFYLISRWVRRRKSKTTSGRDTAPPPVLPPDFDQRRAATSELSSTTARPTYHPPHPGSPLSFSYHPSPAPHQENPSSSQELPASPINPSPGVWQGPGIAMVLPPPITYNSESYIDLTLAQGNKHTGTSGHLPSSDPGESSAPRVEQDANRQLSSPSPQISPLPGFPEPEFELVTRKSMSTILSARAAQATPAKPDEASQHNISRAPTPSNTLS